MQGSTTSQVKRLINNNKPPSSATGWANHTRPHWLFKYETSGFVLGVQRLSSASESNYAEANQLGLESKSQIELLHYSFLAAPRPTSITGIAATPFFHRRCPRRPSDHQAILVRFKNVILGIGVFGSFRVPD
ncbi:hypothetical protein PGT21_020217 [Puccinia graminis f. sp. tritici]|uniref:Uncharacterized protein n=1 Tax=Puccinia graminis f. sp. tritici TaxID=56615 RepID=A0A5B0NNK4_PUCGR|nr:hypothetical protein PGT21_020217 [Puccinia graminis f. sp. tritici]